jgi:hypothetical protein
MLYRVQLAMNNSDVKLMHQYRYRVDVILFGETCRYSILALRQSDLPFFYIESLPMCLYIIVLYLFISMHIISLYLSMLIYIVNYCIRVKTL